MIEIVIAVAVSTVLAGFGGYRLCSHLYAMEVRRIAREKDAAVQTAMEIADERDAALQTKRVTEEQSKVIAEELTKATRKLEAALSANYNFEKSRDEAWDLYRRSSLGAGNAQSMLFKEIQKLTHAVNKYRADKGQDPLQVPEDLQQMISDFSQEHIEEAKRKAQQL